MIERTRRIFADCLSVPKRIGKGPMITTAPPRAFRPRDLASDTTTTKRARNMPATMRIVPRDTRLR